MIFFWGFLAALLLSALATFAVIRLADRWGIKDRPEPQPSRKIHSRETPLLGGLAIISSFLVVSGVFYFALPLLHDNIPLKSMLAVWLAAIILAIGGAWDDKKSLPPAKSFLAPLLASLVVVASGIGVPHITNPWGGQIELIGPAIAGIGVVSGCFVLLWLLGMIYTTKFLDGLDGLATGIGTVAAVVLFALSFTPQVMQPYSALLAALTAGCFAGFLIFNWHPAKIFLGESGSTFIGFILGVLAIIAGGKIATAVLVMGIPILDVGWVIIRRLSRFSSPFRGDAGHLHFRLLRLGLRQRQVVFLFIMLSAVFGGLAVVLQSFGKFIALLAMLAVMMALALIVIILDRRRALKTAERALNE